MSFPGKGHRIEVNVPVPAVGGGPQQTPVDVTQGKDQQCVECGGEFFDQVIKLRWISKMTLTNKTGKDVIVQVIAYVCHKCGAEFKQEHIKP